MDYILYYVHELEAVETGIELDEASNAWEYGNIGWDII